jgi:hypothetical protein
VALHQVVPLEHLRLVVWAHRLYATLTLTGPPEIERLSQLAVTILDGPGGLP